MNKQLVLASGSPRRKELLEQYNLKFKVVVPKIVEILDASLPLEKAIQQIAYDKARAVFSEYPDHIVLAADTIVVCNNQYLGKPKNKDDAFRMLSLLSDNTHTVISGVSILLDATSISFFESTMITFNALSRQEILKYIASEEPFDKAGSYAIQGKASTFVKEIIGDYDNVVGLPITRVLQELKKVWE